MLEGQKGEGGLGSPKVFITNNGAHSPETWADIITNKIIYIGDNAHPALQVQAQAFKNRIHDLLVNYVKQIIETERAYFN